MTARLSSQPLRALSVTRNRATNITVERVGACHTLLHMAEFFHRSPERERLVLVDPPTIRKAQAHILGCETCTDEAQIPFDAVLDGITGNDPEATEYILSEPAKCPRCHRAITEKTLVEFHPED